MFCFIKPVLFYCNCSEAWRSVATKWLGVFGFFFFFLMLQNQKLDVTARCRSEAVEKKGNRILEGTATCVASCRHADVLRLRKTCTDPGGSSPEPFAGISQLLFPACLQTKAAGLLKEARNSNVCDAGGHRIWLVFACEWQLTGGDPLGREAASTPQSIPVRAELI